jgi:dimethylhistidine N-methyltransferase
MHATGEDIPLHDLHPPQGDFRADVLRGLARAQKRLPSMYLYDDEGSRLFDRICQLDEYYPTRTEMMLLEAHAAELAASVGPEAMLIELGSGSSDKTRVLLRQLTSPHSYVPVDIARAPLRFAAARVSRAFPALRVRPVCADFMGEFDLPRTPTPPRRRVVFFPGSTIGNFNPDDRARLYQRVFSLCGEGGAFVIGFDLQKDPTRLEQAYNDEKGVTAAFNLNLLHRINRELGADFDVGQFRHRAHYDAALGRIEMHLVSRVQQRVKVGDCRFEFVAGETVCTEHSYKFTVNGFVAETGACGFECGRVLIDPDGLFAIALLSRGQ